MKVFLVPLLATFALPNAAYANIDPRINEICMSAADYKGCVELYTEKFTLPKCNYFRKTKCTAEIEYENGKYVGEILNGEKHGFGTYYWDSGSRYVGKWVNGRMTGPATRYFAGGDKYVGQYLNDKMSGPGTYYFIGGDKYVGQFKNGNFHGQGTYFYSGGGSWSGEWRNDKKTENGSYNKTAEEKAFQNQLILEMMRQQRWF